VEALVAVAAVTAANLPAVAVARDVVVVAPVAVPVATSVEIPVAAVAVVAPRVPLLS
jgi:hypothetical protein